MAKLSVHSFIIYLLLGFPLFYFVYKFGNLEPLAHDYFQYYHLYQRMDLSKVIAPHNMRFVGAFFVFLLYKFNLFFDTQIIADKYVTWGFLKQVYFCAVLFNYLCVVFTATQLQKLIKEQLNQKLLGVAGGVLYLFGFGTIFYCIMPLTEAFSILLFVVFLRLYFKRNYYGLITLFVLIFQREYLLIVIATLAGLDLLKEKKRYYLIIMMTAIFAFSIYYALRKTIFYTPHLDFQSQPTYMLQQLFSWHVNWQGYFSQLLLAGNLLALYLIVVAYKFYSKLDLVKKHVAVMLVLFLQVNVVSIAGGHGYNASRYFYLVSPLLIYYTIVEAAPLVKQLSS